MNACLAKMAEMDGTFVALDGGQHTDGVVADDEDEENVAPIDWTVEAALPLVKGQLIQVSSARYLSPLRHVPLLLLSCSVIRFDVRFPLSVVSRFTRNDRMGTGTGR